MKNNNPSGFLVVGLLLVCMVGGASASSWSSSVPDMNTERYRFAMAEIDGTIYAAGGFNKNFAGLKTGEKFDVGSGSWQSIADMSSSRVGHFGESVNGKFYVFGGSGNGNTLASAEVYNPQTNSWSSISSMPSARQGAATVELNDKIYIIGGSDSSGNRLSSVLRYDRVSDSYTSLSNMKNVQSLASASVGPDGDIYVFGGKDSSGRTANVQKYDVSQDSWTSQPDMNTVRSLPSAFLSPTEKIHVTGGRDSSGTRLSSSEVFDTDAQSFSQGPAMNTARFGHSNVKVGNSFYVYGGLTPNGITKSGEVLTFNVPPSFNSTSSNQCLIGENCSYSAEAYDSDGSISSLELTVYDDGNQVYQNTAGGTFFSGSNTWNDVYTPSEGSLDARFVATDDAGATTTEWLNRTLEDNPPKITVNSPDSSIKDSNTVSWNVSTEKIDDDPNEELDLKIYKNGNLENTYTITEGDTKTDSLTYSEGTSQTFKAEVVESDGKSDSESVTFDVDTTAPVIDVKNPEGNLTKKTGIDLNYTIQDPHLDSSSCEYRKDNGTRIGISNCGNTTIDFNTAGEHNVTVFGKDTLGHEGSDTSTFFTDYENRISLEDKNSGSTISDFQVTFQNSSGSSAGGSTSDGTFEINTSDLPTGDVEMTLEASAYKIKNVSLDVNSTFELRKTYKMERSSFRLDVKDEQSDQDLRFNFTARNDTTSYTKENITVFEEDYQNFSAKGFPTGSLTITVQDDKGEYRQRKYFVTMDENSVISLTSFLLKKDEGIYISVETYESGGDRLPGVLVNSQKQINGSYRTVAQKITGTTGGASFFLDPDVQYRAVASKSGYSTFEGTFSPVNYQYDPLKIQLGTENTYNFSTRWGSIDYKLRPESRFLNKSKVETLNWTVSDVQGDLTEFGLRVKHENDSLIKSSSVKSSPSGGTVTVDINSSKWSEEKEFKVEAFFLTGGDEYRIEKTYEFEKTWAAGIFSLSQTLNNTQASESSKGLFALLVTAISGAAMGSRFGKDGGGFIAVMVLGIFTIAGWFPFVIWILTFLGLLGVYMLR